MITSPLIRCFDTGETNEIYKLKVKKNKIVEELRKSQKFRVDRDDVFKDMRRHKMKRKELRKKLMETNKKRQKRKVCNSHWAP